MVRMTDVDLEERAKTAVPGRATSRRHADAGDAAQTDRDGGLLLPEPEWDPEIGAPLGGEASPRRGRSTAPHSTTLRHVLLLWKRYRRLMLATTAACVLASALHVFVLSPDVYMAQVTILPSGGQGQGAVLGLLASFTGAPPAAIGGGAEENSSVLFPRILESRAVATSVLRARYTFKADDKAVDATLYEFLEAKNEDEGLRALEFLRAVGVDKETGMITVSVRTPYPELSAQIANRYADALEKVNDEMRHAAAAQHGAFIRERLDQALDELAVAEEKLTQFRSRNVRMNDPALELERLRLERQVTLESQVYVTLNSQAEVASIEEAKNIPLVRILDRAKVPDLPVPVPIVAGIVAGAIVGIVLSLVAVAGIEFGHTVLSEMRRL
jgi:uncharacterized protein involved in exopolysaccharide biosynthesis